MKRMKNLLNQTTLQSVIPGFFGLIILAIQTTFFIQPTLNDNPQNTSGSIEAHLESNNFVWNGLDEARKTASGLSSNSFVFIGVLLCLDVFIQIWAGFKGSRNRKASSLENQNVDSVSRRLSASILLKKIVLYSLMYFFYQAMMSSSISSIKLSKNLEFPLNRMKQSPRILTEKATSLALRDLSDQIPQVTKKPSLSIGRVIGSLKIDPISIFLSSDQQTAFLLTRFSGKLKVVDISNLESPIILSSLTLNRGGQYLNYKSMTLSPDGTKLYISNVDFLEVVDVTDLGNPITLTVVEDNTISSSLKPGEKYPEVCKPTLLISGDNKVLYVSGLGLQIFDISKPESPVLKSSKPSMIFSGILMPSSMHISEDKQTLYYSDGGLHLYDLTVPTIPYEVKSSVSWESPVTSMLLSKDEKTMFVLTLEDKDEVVLKKLTVPNLNMDGSKLRFNQKSSWPPLFLVDTHNDVFLFIYVSQPDYKLWHRLLIFDIEEERLLFNNKILVEDAFYVLFSQDSRNLFVASEGKFNIIELYLDTPNKLAFTENSSILRSFEMNSVMKSFEIDEKGEVLYGISLEKGQFEIYKKTSEEDQLKLLSTYPAAVEKMPILDEKKAFLVVEDKKILTLDISNLEKPILLGEFKISADSKNISGFIIACDGKTGYVVTKSLITAEKAYLDIVDFTDPKDPNLKISVDLPKGQFLKTKMILSKDQKTLFLIEDQIVIYDVSNPLKPLYRGSAFVLDGVEIDYFDAVLSHDENTLFVKFGPKNRHIKLHCFNVSNKTSSPPKIISEMTLTSSESNENNITQSMRISPDSKKIYIARNQYLLVIDVGIPTNPTLLGTIRTVINDNITNFELSSDGKTGYISTTKSAQVHEISIEQPVDTVFLKEERFLLGEKYSMEAMILKLDNKRDYVALEEEYKFTKFGLVEINLLRNAKLPEMVFKMAPSWLNFDLNTRTLALESKRSSDIGTYRVYFVYSTKIPQDVFSNNQVINKSCKSEDLLAVLISMGYVDNQLFLTKNFGDYGDFILDSQYFGIKEEIYKVLKQYSFETFNLIEVVPSLSLEYSIEAQKLKVKTTSPNSLKIDISLNCNQVQFLNKNYATLPPTIEEKKSRLILEGSLKEINQALEEIVINLQEEVTSYDGVITLNDKLNPPVIESVKDITKFFNSNEAPMLDKNFPMTVQSQVNAVTVYTGQYFQIQVNQSTFIDNYTSPDKLKHRLVIVNKDNLETTIPSWLYFNDLTMMGTAPEIVLSRDIELVLVVANEFQQLRIPFILHVNISSSFALKLLIKFSPYILSIVGLIISANKIYNILAKKRYRHPKSFYVRIGEEVTCDTIFPISFIGEEARQAKKILELLKKRGRILPIEEGNFDKQRVGQLIKEAIDELTSEERVDYEESDIINQIVMNELVDSEFKSRGEKKTKVIYEKIKDKWFEVVEWDTEFSCFRINNAKFEKLKGELDLDKPEKDSELLIEKDGFNEELLKNAILGYAFKSHNINEVHLRVQIRCMEKMKRSNFIKRFLKIDLKEITCTDKGKVGYGIGYIKKNNRLSFNGVVEEDIKRRTLVIQFTNTKQKILKELWIYNDGLVSEKMMVGNEKDGNWNKTQEKGYEIF